MPSEGEIGAKTRLQDHQPSLFEPRDFYLNEWLVLDALERPSAPKRKRPPKGRGCGLDFPAPCCLLSAGDEVLELVDIEVAVVNLQ